jgi:hypothetical protein
METGVTESWRKIHSEELHNVPFTQQRQGDQINEDEIDMARRMHETR